MTNVEKLASSISNLKLINIVIISITISSILVIFSCFVDYKDYLANDVSCEQIRQGKLPKNLDCENLEKEYRSNTDKQSNEYYRHFLEQDLKTCSALNHRDIKSALENYNCDYKRSTFIDWATRKNVLDGIIVITFWLLLFISIVRVYYKERSKGWRRLAITSSIILSIIATLFVSDEYDYSLLPIIMGLFPPALLIVLLLKRIYLWIKDGFEKDNDNSNQSDLIDDESKDNKLKLKIFETKKIDENQKHKDLLKLRSASFLNRFFARSIDLAFVFGLTIYTIYLLAKIPNFGDDSAIFSLIVAVIVLNLASFGYEYICLILFEASLGKIIFNMVVLTKECGSLNNNGCIDRSWKIIKNCFGFFMVFPLLQIYLTLKARNDLKKYQSTSYDKNAYLVKQKEISFLRWFCSATLSIVLLLSSLVVVEILKK